MFKKINYLTEDSLDDLEKNVEEVKKDKPITSNTNTGTPEDNLDDLEDEVSDTTNTDNNDETLNNIDGDDEDDVDDTIDDVNADTVVEPEENKKLYTRITLFNNYQDLLSVSHIISNKISDLQDYIDDDKDNNIEKYKQLSEIDEENNKIQEQIRFILDNYIDNMDTEKLTTVLKAICVKMENILKTFDSLSNETHK